MDASVLYNKKSTGSVAISIAMAMALVDVPTESLRIFDVVS